ncbi:hypothetical protein Q5P01_021771 [Channa striata]|uniref:G-protein coupled receptors family 1 profile domain-containing protein n=1 Tax=Channa striata TaxID=64152 RepID=A0AA88LUY7_CHASR|nr:hypothetical protein Q5P01_021771 [Channa striata]
MDNFHHNDSLYEYSDYDHAYDHIQFDHENAEFIMNIVTWIIIVIGLPSNIVALFASYTQVQKDHVVPIYFINLLVSDLIQLCCMIVFVTAKYSHIFHRAYDIFTYSLMASVYFMLCIALDRYLFVACPLWHRSKLTIRISVVLCAAVWSFVLVICLPLFFGLSWAVTPTVHVAFLFLPSPLLIFFLGGTIKALSSASASHDEKCKTLADVFLYCFLRKGSVDKCLGSLCCKMESNGIDRSAAKIDNMSTVSFM